MAAWSAAKEAAWLDALLGARESGRPVALPTDLAPGLSPERALALHEAHAERLLARIGGTRIGRKIGGSSEAALQALNLECPFVGPILSARTQSSPARFARRDFMACILEAEVAVRLGRDLPLAAFPNRLPTRAQLLDAIDQVAPAIELADSRIAEWSAGSAAAIVSDLGYAGAWVRGAACEGWRDIDLRTLAVAVTRDGDVVRNGAGTGVLGDPLHALALVAADQARAGRPLLAGEWISTGSMALPMPVEGGGRFVADFGPLGRVELELTA